MGKVVAFENQKQKDRKRVNNSNSSLLLFLYLINTLVKLILPLLMDN